jgi:hypothetical protein
MGHGQVFELHFAEVAVVTEEKHAAPPFPDSQHFYLLLPLVTPAGGTGYWEVTRVSEQRRRWW